MNKNTLLIGIIALLIGIIATNMYYSNNMFWPDSDLRQGMRTYQMGRGNMMSGMMSNMMTVNMRGRSGKDLEEVFLIDMIPHHQGAVDMAKLLLQDKTLRPELIDFANSIITTQEREIEQMQVWLKDY